MRGWLGKPLLLVALIVVLLAAVSIWCVWAGPLRAGASGLSSPRQHQVDQLIRQIERGQ